MGLTGVFSPQAAQLPIDFSISDRLQVNRGYSNKKEHVQIIGLLGFFFISATVGLAFNAANITWNKKRLREAEEFQIKTLQNYKSDTLESAINKYTDVLKRKYFRDKVLVLSSALVVSSVFSAFVASIFKTEITHDAYILLFKVNIITGTAALAVIVFSSLFFWISEDSLNKNEKGIIKSFCYNE